MINDNFLFVFLVCDMERMYGRGVTLHVLLVPLFTVLHIILTKGHCLEISRFFSANSTKQ